MALAFVVAFCFTVYEINSRYILEHFSVQYFRSEDVCAVCKFVERTLWCGGVNRQAPDFVFACQFFFFLEKSHISLNKRIIKSTQLCVIKWVCVQLKYFRVDPYRSEK